MENKDTIAPDGLAQEHYDWAATYPDQRKQEIVKFCRQYPEFDAKELFLGHLLDRIVNDDVAIFSATYLFPQKREISRKTFIARIGWELGQEELPEEIKPSLEEVLEEFKKRPWQTEEDVQKARKFWEKKVKQPVSEIVTNEEATHPWRKSYVSYKQFEYSPKRIGMRQE